MQTQFTFLQSDKDGFLRELLIVSSFRWNLTFFVFFLLRSWYVCGGFAGARGFSQGRRQCFQPPPLRCVRSWAVLSLDWRVWGQNKPSNQSCSLLFSRIHDNEGAAEMLIDTLGPSIVNAKDSKNRYNVQLKVHIINWKNGLLFWSMTPVLWWRFSRTPLHAASFTDHVECLQLLLSQNAQVNSVDASGKTSLMMAAENGQTNAVGTNDLITRLENIPMGRTNQSCIKLSLFSPP